jgi:hypothetical protein
VKGGLSRQALEDGGAGELRHESSGQTGEKEEERKGHRWRDLPRSEADGERFGGGKHRQPVAVQGSRGVTTTLRLQAVAAGVQLGSGKLPASTVAPVATSSGETSRRSLAPMAAAAFCRVAAQGREEAA